MKLTIEGKPDEIKSMFGDTAMIKNTISKQEIENALDKGMDKLVERLNIK